MVESSSLNVVERSPTESFLALLKAHSGSPKTIAHRGDSYRAPENTLEAAELAFQSGAFAWELDVHLSRDGIPVVIHDDSLRRTTNVESIFQDDIRALTDYQVSDFHLEELLRLDCGSWFVSEAGGARSSRGFQSQTRVPTDTATRCREGLVRIPTLRQALEFTRQRNWLVNVEIKSYPRKNDDLAGVVVAQIIAVDFANGVLVSSFDHQDLAEVRKLAPSIATGLLVDQPLFQPLRYLEELVGSDCFHPSVNVLGANSEAYLRSPSSNNLRRDQIRPFVETHRPILVYTVNDDRPDGLASHLIDAGVSAVFTDDPEGLIKLFSGTRSF